MRSMSDETSWLLSDEFVAFSTKIATIYEDKKQKKQQLKEFYEKITNDLKVLDQQALDLEKDFQKWKKTQEKS